MAWMIRWASPALPARSAWNSACFEMRQQPFTLFLQSRDGRLCVRCISPIGRVVLGMRDDEILEALAQRAGIRVGVVIPDKDAIRLDRGGRRGPGGGRDPRSGESGALLRRVIRRADAIERLLMPGAGCGDGGIRPAASKEFSDGR